MTTYTRPKTEVAALNPRRITHANLYVADWLASLGYYTTVAGLEEVFRETPIKAGFLSSGNTHHDIAVMEKSSGPRIGRDGFVQTRAGIGATVEFNHFGIEMENLRDLVESYDRLVARGVEIEKLTDSDGLSKSIYLRDPDGTLLQFYADTTSDWRGYFGGGDRLVTGPWDPHQDRDCDPTPKYTVDPVHYRSPDAAFQPIGIRGGVLAVADLRGSEAFYVDVAGFDPVYRAADGSAVVLSAGGLNRDLTLVQTAPGNRPGLCHFSFQIASVDDLIRGYQRLEQFNVLAMVCLDHGLSRSIRVADPDGFVVEFFADTVDDWRDYLRSGRPFSYPGGTAWQPLRA